ncbi:MAG: hypothetical protein ACJ8IQ_09270 [Chthoniobacterales bacterium]
MKAVDGLQLDDEHRAILKPGAEVQFENGSVHRLPRFFFEVPSWPAARERRIARHFTLAELMMVDSREAPLQLRQFPHYVPCSIVLLARVLESFRNEAGAPVFVSANGGYRSPAHQLSRLQTMHQWGTAADIYRVGDTYLNDEKSIERYARVAASIGDDVYVRPYVGGNDHLHIDIGFAAVTPPELSE